MKTCGEVEVYLYHSLPCELTILNTGYVCWDRTNHLVCLKFTNGGGKDQLGLKFEAAAADDDDPPGMSGLFVSTEHISVCWKIHFLTNCLL